MLTTHSTSIQLITQLLGFVTIKYRNTCLNWQALNLYINTGFTLIQSYSVMTLNQCLPQTGEVCDVCMRIRGSQGSQQQNMIMDINDRLTFRTLQVPFHNFLSSCPSWGAGPDLRSCWIRGSSLHNHMETD